MVVPLSGLGLAPLVSANEFWKWLDWDRTRTPYVPGFSKAHVPSRSQKDAQIESLREEGNVKKQNIEDGGKTISLFLFSLSQKETKVPRLSLTSRLYPFILMVKRFPQGWFGHFPFNCMCINYYCDRQLISNGCIRHASICFVYAWKAMFSTTVIALWLSLWRNLWLIFPWICC